MGGNNIKIAYTKPPTTGQFPILFQHPKHTIKRTKSPDVQ